MVLRARVYPLAVPVGTACVCAKQTSSQQLSVGLVNARFEAAIDGKCDTHWSAVFWRVLDFMAASSASFQLFHALFTNELALN